MCDTPSGTTDYGIQAALLVSICSWNMHNPFTSALRPITTNLRHGNKYRRDNGFGLRIATESLCVFPEVGPARIVLGFF